MTCSSFLNGLKPFAHEVAITVECLALCAMMIVVWSLGIGLPMILIGSGHPLLGVALLPVGLFVVILDGLHYRHVMPILIPGWPGEVDHSLR